MVQTTTYEVESIVYTQAELLAALGLPSTATITSVTYDYTTQQMTIMAQGVSTVTGTP